MHCACVCRSLRLYLFFFFFQAEDGIRDVAVTGVQTCALPISSWAPRGPTSGCSARARSWRETPGTDRRRPPGPCGPRRVRGAVLLAAPDLLETRGRAPARPAAPAEPTDARALPRGARAEPDPPGAREQRGDRDADDPPEIGRAHV